MDARSPCADQSRARGEPLTATASRVDHWLLVEYRGLWRKELLAGSVLAPEVKEHLRAQLVELPASRLLFIRRRERRGHPTIHVFYGSSRSGAVPFRALELAGYGELLDLDLAGALLGRAPPVGEPLEHPLFVVCTHGKRDRCCATFGRPLFEALSRRLGGWAWQSSHLGGDRFAGNVVCLPAGLCYGRVYPEDVGALLDRHLAGEVYLDRYRGCTALPFPAQAAEEEVRRQTGILGIGSLSLLACEREETGFRVSFRGPDGAVIAAWVEVSTSEPLTTTCKLERPRPVRRFAATLARPAGG